MTHRIAKFPQMSLRADRRSVYLQQRRTQVATFLELFDAPSIAATCSARSSTTPHGIFSGLESKPFGAKG